MGGFGFIFWLLLRSSRAKTEFAFQRLLEGADQMSVVQVSYFSDVLCIWAYAAQARIDAVKEKFGDTVRLDYRFCSVFGDAGRMITSAWRGKGEYTGFNSHLRKVARQFPHTEVHPEIWLKTRSPTSASAHLFYDGGPAMGT